MTPNLSPIERAFELARSGKCQSFSEIKAALKAEGYDSATITGGTLSKQLRQLIAASSKS
ncbi:hypothetical protein [Devosia marina]|uniref:Uncharacterized protein n=1 Tax=Devosia marina TaxID=2683198 RepID=A0A7X3K4E7_9HYPH|nr:hypothetical protein [Devosia marina]MVS99529.1 hypothetical protein [Devosia marina]